MPRYKGDVKPIQDRTQWQNERPFAARGATVGAAAYDKPDCVACSLCVYVSHKATRVAAVRKNVTKPERHIQRFKVDAS